MHIGMKDGAPFAFAGLWTRWGAKGEEQFETFTIITGEPNEVSAPIHNRMPVIIAPADYARWLDVDHPESGELLRPYPPDNMTAYAISTRVNSPKNDDATLIDPETA